MYNCYSVFAFTCQHIIRQAQVKDKPEDNSNEKERTMTEHCVHSCRRGN